MPNLIAKAISKGLTVWLRELLAKRLPSLPTDIDGCNHWYNSLIATFKVRGLTEPSQQKNYLTQVRNAIKVIDPKHPALDVVKFDTKTWIEINNTDNDRIASRNTKFISNPETIVERARKLLESYEWSEIAAGLAVLTGRRSSEVVKTARFEYKTQYSVIFSGSLKRRDEVEKCVFEIPTLCQAELVINAIANLRGFLGDEIKELSNKQISGRYSRAVSKKCDEHFVGLVPRRVGEDNLYTHLFRAVYATIASYWYCPPIIPEMEYRAAIQGHYQILDEQNPELRRSLAAGRHYFDYKISDGSGNIDGRLGTKLGQPGVEVIEQFSHSLLKEVKESPLKKNTSKQSNLLKRKIMSETIIIPKYLMSRLSLLSERLEINEKDTLEALFDWSEVSLSLAEILEIDELKPNVLYDKVEELKEQSTQTQHYEQPKQETTAVENISFDAQSINNLCSSVKILAEALTQQKVTPKNKSKDSFRSIGTIKNKNLTQGINEKEERNERKVSSRTTEAEAVINHAINLIIEYNEVPGRTHDDKFRVGIGAIRKMTKRGDKVIRRMIESRNDEIKAHHEKHKLGEFHNSKGKEAPPIDTVIPLTLGEFEEL